MFEIGTQVIHSGHGEGKIIGINQSQENEYLLSNRGLKLLDTVPINIITTSAFYPGNRYPYLIKFNSGYTDVYSDREFIAIK